MQSFLFDSFHHGLGSVLDLRSQQHALTASNIANADTPNYKAKYIAFEELLSGAVASEDAHLALKQTRPTHMGSLLGDTERPHIEEMAAPAWSMDGNSVQLEQETVRLTENSMMYGAVSKGLSRRLAMLRYAASDGRG